MDNLNFLSESAEVMKLLRCKGGLLVTKSNICNKKNVMTISWATFGVMWKKPILMVMLRNNTFTYGVIEKASSFTLNIPINGLKDALDFCGTKSGYVYDKFKECNLSTSPARKIDTPIINCNGFHYECKIVYKSIVDLGFLSTEYREKWYTGKFTDNLHTFYFGEILSNYKTFI